MSLFIWDTCGILISPGFNDCYIMVGPDGTVLEYYHYGSINVEFMSFLC